MTHPLPPLLPTGHAAQQPAAMEGWPLLRLGFRPFYLGAALLACLSVPLWIAIFLGHIQLDLPVSPLLWHAHEMLFGFGSAVLAGFLLTAVPNWTGSLPVSGTPLIILAGFWLAGRLVFLYPDLIHFYAAIALESLFLPLLLGKLRQQKS